MVNDLWNPNLDEKDGVLLLDNRDKFMLDFVKENTKIFDSSHNWQHAVQVAYNSTRIFNTKFVLYLALLHDVCDHKYDEAISRDLLSKFILDNLPEFENEGLDDLIDRVSYSKQKENSRLSNVNSEIPYELSVVRDGDRLEAIGDIGIDRCIAFVKSKNRRVPEDVIIHCYDKLLRLLPDGYIITELGKKDAVKRHNVIVKYVRDNLPEYL